jgi:hypothetical protein
MPRGMKPTDRVERTERQCDICQERTMHEKSVSGRGGVSIKWECIPCRRKRQRIADQNGRRSRTVTRVKKIEVKRPVCTGCFIELPTSGICDDC